MAISDETVVVKFSWKKIKLHFEFQTFVQLAADIVMGITKVDGYEKGQVHIHSDNGSPMKGTAPKKT